jgi:hypothetical protein
VQLVFGRLDGGPLDHFAIEPASGRGRIRRSDAPCAQKKSPGIPSGAEILPLMVAPSRCVGACRAPGGMHERSARAAR